LGILYRYRCTDGGEICHGGGYLQGEVIQQSTPNQLEIDVRLQFNDRRLSVRLLYRCCHFRHKY